MELNNINLQDIIFSLDIGTRSVIGTIGIVREKKFHVIAEKYVEHEERAMIDGQIHDINLVAVAVNSIKKSLEQELNLTLKNVSIAAAGRFLRTTTSKAEIEVDYDKEIDKDTIRSLELTAVKIAEEEINKQTEGKLYCVGYSIINYYLNGYVISNLLSHKGESIAVEVISTFLPRSVVDSLYSVMEKVDLNVVSLTLEPIAAMEAVIPQNLRLLNLALVDIGAGTSDIAISSKDTISAYGMTPLAGDEVTEVISQNYLVDFNTAERMKRECSINEKVTYTDILGLENEVLSEDIINTITPVVKKIADEIGAKVIELNGGKAPNAVFLVGGGAHTQKIKECIADKIKIPVQRIGIKGREAINNCICPDNSLGSIGVTVLGIALVAIKKMGHDFIDVNLNGSIISLFNSNKHTVMDVMLQAGINPKVLIGKNGKNIRFTLNGAKRIAFGTLSENATILINGKISSIDSEIREGDNINITFAKDGKDATPKVTEFINNINAISFYINDILINIEPFVMINGGKALLNNIITEGDIVDIIYPTTIGQYIELFDEDKEYKYYLQDKELPNNYIILEGDRIHKIKIEPIKDTLDTEITEEASSVYEQQPDEEMVAISKDIDVKDSKSNEISVLVNDQPITLKNKENYIFIDIFDYIKFDRTNAKGNLVLKLNGKRAGYYDVLSSGDNILVRWEE